ncbi:hypothetical protein Ssi02_73510 [Sinosporangium siamense]|uniref:histidine kinase n=1 Tax=Sinosporangium siamense TaxID=1367973 RepID=A0A919RNN6_9ACTN|nr:hypothetical protein Ssi02_73510 [Sinosporangium siamense]
MVVLAAGAATHLVVVPFMLFGLLLSFGLGMVFLFNPIALQARRLTEHVRRRTTLWSGVELAAPYHPAPPPPVPEYNGWYRVDRTLYKTPRYPAWNMRWKWLINDPATWRDFLWITLNPLITFSLLALPLLAVGYGLTSAWWLAPWTAPFGIAAAVAGLIAVPWVLLLHDRWTRILLSATRRSELQARVQSLTRARVNAADSQAAELRRIERDLHDGAQARLVAMGMTLGAAEELIERDPQAAKALLVKAREASAAALSELRQLVRGIHPPVLAERGLGDAVRAMALDTPLNVTVTVDLPERLDQPVESAAYFAVSELLTNATKHGEARNVTIDISKSGAALQITVADDGNGGADPSRGSGLRGIERRLEPFDGVLAVNSPPGGPTLLAIDLPHAFADAVPAKKPMPKWMIAVVTLCYALAWLPLFPQGIVAAVFKIGQFVESDGEIMRAWCLALYLPEFWQWPFIAFMIALGTIMYVAATVLPIWHSKERWMKEATAGRPRLGC